MAENGKPVYAQENLAWLKWMEAHIPLSACGVCDSLFVECIGCVICEEPLCAGCRQYPYSSGEVWCPECLSSYLAEEEAAKPYEPKIVGGQPGINTCLDCGQDFWLTQKEISSHFRERCTYCGSAYLQGKGCSAFQVI